MNMSKTISKKIFVKASSSKPSGKPLPGDKTLGLDPEIRFYAIEDDGKTEEGQVTEILAIYVSSLATSKQKIVKRDFHYIDTFNHEGPTVIIVMRNLTVGVFEHL